ADGADALLEVAAGVGGLARDLEGEEDAALARGDDVAAGTAGLGVEHAARLAPDPLDHGARGGRGDLLIAGDEAGERGRRAAEALEGRQHEGVEDEPALHVDHAGPVGATTLDAERPARHLALGEYGVAVAHQHDRALVRRLVVEADVDGVAEALVRLDAGRHLLLAEEADEARAHRVDAGLVVAAAV